MIDYFFSSTVVLLIGIAFSVYPPTKIHGKYGYRSQSALRSSDNWQKAQKLSKRYLIVSGVVGLLASMLVFVFFPGRYTRLFAVAFPVVLLVISVLRIEKKLKD